MRTTALSCAFVLAGIFANQAHADLITIDPSQIWSYAEDYHYPDYWYDFEVYYSWDYPPIPTNTTKSASIGEASSQTDFAFNEVAGQTILHMDMHHTYAADVYSYGDTHSSTMYFTALANASYGLSGEYTLSGDGSARLFAELYDVTAGLLLFSNTQVSYSILDQSLTLGQLDGDFENYLYGSQSGSLSLGHQYQWNFYAAVGSYDGINNDYSSNAGSGEGFLTLTISDATISTPEPTSMALLGLASLGGLGLRLRRKRVTQDAQAAA